MRSVVILLAFVFFLVVFDAAAPQILTLIAAMGGLSPDYDGTASWELVFFYGAACTVVSFCLAICVGRMIKPRNDEQGDGAENGVVEL